MRRTGALLLATALGLGGCGPRFDRGERSAADFARDRHECLAQTSEFSPSRYRPSRWTDWKQYARCMEAKGYRRK